MEKLNVNLHDDSLAAPIRVEVDPLDCVSVLTKYVPGGGAKLLLYNNCFLMNAFTFKFFGIPNDADLYFVPVPVQPRKRPARTSRQRLRTARYQLERERCRVADVIIQRMESNYRTMRKMVDRFTNTYSQVVPDDTCEEQSGSFTDNKGQGPSTETLPVLWETPTSTSD